MAKGRRVCLEDCENINARELRQRYRRMKPEERIYHVPWAGMFRKKNGTLSGVPHNIQQPEFRPPSPPGDAVSCIVGFQAKGWDR
jgi:hypothetical protein